MSAVTEPIMSIWLMSDYRRWQEDLVNSDVDCLVTNTGRRSDGYVVYVQVSFERQNDLPSIAGRKLFAGVPSIASCAGFAGLPSP